MARNSKSGNRQSSTLIARSYPTVTFTLVDVQLELKLVLTGVFRANKCLQHQLHIITPSAQHRGLSYIPNMRVNLDDQSRSLYYITIYCVFIILLYQVRLLCLSILTAGYSVEPRYLLPCSSVCVFRYFQFNTYMTILITTQYCQQRSNNTLFWYVILNTQPTSVVYSHTDVWQ